MSFDSHESPVRSGAAEPESASEAAAADPDPQFLDSQETDKQPPEAAQSADVQLVKTEASSAPSEGEISKEFDDVNLQNSQLNVDAGGDAEQGKDEGDRMVIGELSDGLKNGDSGSGGGGEADYPHGEPNSEQQSNTAMELINSVTGLDEEGRSRQRVLTFAAKRYAAALEKNPEDYDALYNWALVLQETADNVSPESNSPSKDALLGEACKKYEEATHLCSTLNDAFYNWAIAISDRAKLRGRTKEAEELWKQATDNYQKAVQLNWNSPQALNNWGLALQELSGIVRARDKQMIVRAAVGKFRAAIQLQYDFHRAIYNLGTVLYGLAEDLSRTGGHINVKGLSNDELYSLSAMYIAAAHALKPNYSVYTSALKLVRSMLPLPYMKVGQLGAPPAGNPVAPHNKWKKSQFVLDHDVLLVGSKVEYSSPRLSSESEMSSIRIEVQDIVSVSACADLTLPYGAGLCIDTIKGPVYLVAESWECMDGWVDAIRLVYTVFTRGKRDVLANILTA